MREHAREGRDRLEGRVGARLEESEVDAKNDRDAIEANADQEEYCFAVRDTLQDEEPVDEPEVLQGIGVAMQLRAFDLLRPEAATKAPEVDNGEVETAQKLRFAGLDPAARETLWDVTIVKTARLWRETGNPRRRQCGTGGSQ